MRKKNLFKKIMIALLITLITVIPAPALVSGVEVTPVCSIGGTNYTSLGSALAAHQSGETIKLLTDQTYNSAIIADNKALNIDLNGFHLTVENVPTHALQSINNGNLNIYDMTSTSGILTVNTSGEEKAGVYVSAGGDATLSGSISAIYSSGNYQGITGIFANGTGSTVQLTGSAIGYYAGVYCQDGAEVIVNGSVSGSYYGAIAAYTGNIIINGNVTAATNGLTVEYGGSASINGNILSSDIGIYARNGEGHTTAQAIIIGNVSGNSYGISASSRIQISVSGDVTGGNCSVAASEGSAIAVSGSAITTVSNSIGIFASSYPPLTPITMISINGEVNVPGNGTFARIDDVAIATSDKLTLTTKTGYNTYEGVRGTSLWVSIPTPPTPPSPPSTSSSGGGAPSPAITIITEVNPGTTSNLVQLVPTITGDTANASVSGSVLEALLTKARATDGTGSRDVLQVNLDTPADLNQLKISLPQRELSQITANSDSSLALHSPFLSVHFDHKALDVITSADQGGSVQVTATVVDPKVLAPEDQKKVEGRPVFDFTVTNGDTRVSDFKNGHATVTIPYTLEPGENPSSIIVYYLADDGKLEVVRGHYDKNSNALIFKTKHFSNFLIGYNPVSFADVRTNAWYEDAVRFLSARGITSGTTTNTFSPSQQLTRAQFLVLAMNGYRINPVSDIENSGIENFADAGNRYYSAYLLKAKEIGLTQGIGNNLFAPDRPITRQEMFVLLYNILEQLEEMPLPEDPNRIMEFQDVSSLSAWAKEPAFLLYQSGIIEGSNNLLNPKGTATRAEMAQILYNLLTE